ncbi:hypothetical protein HOP50_01g03820 [Chloropicon primus]|uniref:Uncharacterized protein n=1 Tax=Chloropicon primus TaxID=1764295 RepID=A0A5B8MBN1_9CHLO|nr:hypothetical protein A3770_01p03940 [Chloropicon primus]UPQ97091.1 hypothetical protein HOP50_01g03820 [Chloropicon primus]|eukprot:QDZ17876.1 hypothetical protein A3770_01p03940 [Chloropicon primus]
MVAASATDDHDEDHHKCACEARKYGVSISCTSLNVMLVEKAIEHLQLPSNNCNATKNACPGHFFLLQAHHDFCPHDVLPAAAEKLIHDYEDNYEECEIARQYDVSLPNCEPVSCADPSLFTNAVTTLANNNCNTTCGSPVCKAAIQTLLMGHDSCDHDELTEEAEKGLHDYEEACEDFLCNTRTSLYDPSKEVCPGDVHDDDHRILAATKSDDDVKLDVVIGIVCGIGLLLIGVAGAMVFLIQREKKGKPVFAALV